jgi:epoxyqueuosine reductase
VKSSIQQKAAELEFDACRFTSAAAPGSAGRFQQWLNASRHGEMQYLERNSAKRVNIQAVLPEA